MSSRLLRRAGSALHRPGLLLLVPALLLVTLSIVGSWYLRVYFGRVSLDQLLFHLQQGGLEWADSQIVWRGLRTLALWLLLCLLLLALHLRLRRLGRGLLWLLLAAGSAVSLATTFEDRCASPPPGGDAIAGDYVDPRRQQLSLDGAPPDLLLIYVESLDAAYAGRRVFGEPLVPELSRWRAQHARLGRMQMLDGSSWTMAGMFSSLCGLPLQSLGLLTAKSSAQASRFFANGLCLSDLLAAQGWELSFYGGASLDFAGKGRFLAAHGVTRRFGREQWAALGVPLPEDGWGLPDAALAEQVERQWQRPRRAGEPRASLVLTVNTHDPHGNADPGCAAPAGDDEAARLRAALACSDGVIVDLVQRFVARQDGRPKLVWIMGDHLSKGHPLLARLQAQARQPRAVFHAAGSWDAQGRAKPLPNLERSFSHLDVFPTLAQLLGLRWAPQSDRLGLGVSLLAPQAPPTLVERRTLPRLNAEFACPSPLFAELWT